MSIFEKVKEEIRIADVVERYGVKLNNGDKALCPFHSEKTPSFSVSRKDNIFKCFGCGATGDAITFVSKIKGIDSLAAAKELADEFHIDVDEYEKTVSDRKKNVSDYIKECIRNADKTDYFAYRGLTANTVKRYKLGYDLKRKAIVIPYSSKLEYYQSRSVAEKSFYKPKTEDAGHEPLFNRSALWNTKQPIFIVESPLCALSIMQCGAAAVSLCGTSGINKLIKEVKEKVPTGILILSLDNDEPSVKASAQLEKELQTLKVRYDVINVAEDKKDPNELLMQDPELLKSNILAACKMAKQKYKTDKDSVTAFDLQKTVIPPPNWIVNDILPEGLGIICAPSKTGKSWMMLQLCIAVCSGKEFLNFTTHKSDCLYYALEDSRFRLKDRMNKLLKNAVAPKNLHLTIKAESIDGGLLEKIESEINEYPEIRLVIIDTLQKIRGRSNRAETAYTSDYREMSVLKDFADSHKICLLLVHHLRKMADENDVFNMISGSNGIMGACDTIFILSKKKRGDESATLSVTGRDVKQLDLVVKFDTDDYLWMVVGTAEEEEERRKRKAYEDNPIVKVIKKKLELPPFEWRGTATDIMKEMYDESGQKSLTTSANLGKEIKAIETLLYYDGIDHFMKRSGQNRIHIFKKRIMGGGKVRQEYLFSDDD